MALIPKISNNEDLDYSEESSEKCIKKVEKYLTKLKKRSESQDFDIDLDSDDKKTYDMKNKFNPITKNVESANKISDQNIRDGTIPYRPHNHESTNRTIFLSEKFIGKISKPVSSEHGYELLKSSFQDNILYNNFLDMQRRIDKYTLEDFEELERTMKQRPKSNFDNLDDNQKLDFLRE